MNLHMNASKWLEQTSGELCLELNDQKLEEALQKLRAHPQDSASGKFRGCRPKREPQDASRTAKDNADQDGEADEVSARAA